MPRAPKTTSATRLQPYAACIACRTNKKRCSGTFPCSNCIHKGQADSCHAGGRPDESRTWTSRSPDGPAPIPPMKEPSSPEAPHRTHPRMLRNLQGERVYIGNAASLSFLQLLRDTVTQHIGPSQFSHNVKSEDMLETETPHDVAVREDHFTREQEWAFVETYFMATSGFICIIDRSEAKQILEEAHASETGRALADLMIAIGAQARRSDPTTVQAERFFFDRGQRKAFASMLENPSLELVRLFLLMAFYMLGACRRNAGFMYLGVAARAAVALGLHNPEYLATTDALRSRIWMSLCVLDLMVSSILGRPSATATLRPDVGNMVTTCRAEESLRASYRMALILDDIISRVYNEKSASAEAAESFLGKLNQWKDSLSDSLLSPPRDESPLAHEQVICSLHVACSYHFAVIAVTRPFLVSVLSLRLARLAQDASEGMAPIPPEEAAHTKLAAACVDSAMYMMQTCLEVHHSRLLLGNMCLLKAFVFAAALVLGFSMFSQREVDPGLDEAFDGAIEILRMLSQQSAQAAHYCEILTMLGNAIREQRQRLTSQRRGSSQYVSKLFSLNNQPQPASAEPETGSRAISPVSNHANNVYLLAQDSLFNMTPEMESLFSGWEGMELPLWDSFPYLTERG